MIVKTKPKRGQEFWDKEAREFVYLERILDDGKYLCSPNIKRRTCDDYYEYEPDRLTIKPKGRQQISSKLKPKSQHQIAQSIADKARSVGLSVWFADQLLIAPQYCENCKKPINAAAYSNPRTIIAHIVPKSEKSGFPSVATHPLNRWFGCGDCHTNYDKKGADYQETMRVAEICRDRFRSFMNEITNREAKRLPYWLYKIWTTREK